jgi:hypothetical protein
MQDVRPPTYSALIVVGFAIDTTVGAMLSTVTVTVSVVTAIGEGVVTCVAGGGCELDCGAFINIRRDIDGITAVCRLVRYSYYLKLF